MFAADRVGRAAKPGFARTEGRVSQRAGKHRKVINLMAEYWIFNSLVRVQFPNNLMNRDRVLPSLERSG